MINLQERMLPTLAGVEPATSWSPVARRIQLSHRGHQWHHAKQKSVFEAIRTAKVMIRFHIHTVWSWPFLSFYMANRNISAWRKYSDGTNGMLGANPGLFNFSGSWDLSNYHTKPYVLWQTAGIIFWRDFAIFSHFFARNRIKIPGVRKKIAHWFFLISRR